MAHLSSVAPQELPRKPAFDALEVQRPACLIAARMTALSVEAAWTAQTRAKVPYNRQALDCGIAHLGLGNFHRAHQARYLDELLRHEPGPWMIHGIGCLDGDKPLLDAMASQSGLYTLT